MKIVFLLILARNQLVYRLVDRLKKTGIPWGSFHYFRHFAACELINNGVPIEVVREFLGHSDIKSTLVYARLKGEKPQEAVNGFDTTLTQIEGQQFDWAVNNWGKSPKGNRTPLWLF
jgi:integrase